MGFTGYSVTIETLVGTPLAGALENVRSWLSLTWPIRALSRPPRTEKLLKHSRFAPRKLKFAADSSLEGTGFEPPVPLLRRFCRAPIRMPA
jgi:hypothetical protein